MKHLLLLAGTAEARAIAAALRDRFRVTASLAGATARPADLGVPTRTGGFGGATGLQDFIRREGVDLLIDATHPFAAGMKANAAAQTVPVLHVIRPPWRPGPGDDWTMVPDLEAAARALPADARAFLALGARHLDAFRDHPAGMLVRSVDAPPAPEIDPGVRSDGNHHDSEGARASHAIPRAPTGSTFIQGAPGDIEEETALLREHRITHLVCRNSGGPAGRAKLDAARALGLPVIMADRPAPPGGETVETADGAVRWALARGGR